MYFFAVANPPAPKVLVMVTESVDVVPNSTYTANISVLLICYFGALNWSPFLSDSKWIRGIFVEDHHKLWNSRSLEIREVIYCLLLVGTSCQEWLSCVIYKFIEHNKLLPFHSYCFIGYTWQAHRPLYLLWYPVFVPQMLGGFFPVCPAAAKVSVHAPEPPTTKPLNSWKSNLNWQMSSENLKQRWKLDLNFNTSINTIKIKSSSFF